MITIEAPNAPQSVFNRVFCSPGVLQKLFEARKIRLIRLSRIFIPALTLFSASPVSIFGSFPIQFMKCFTPYRYERSVFSRLMSSSQSDMNGSSLSSSNSMQKASQVDLNVFYFIRLNTSPYRQPKDLL